ncbi:hypothetical protein Phpb_03156 [Photorhabdus namnaonensis]|uniref:Uncharacterized protein n=1 Tax=Photorhabdus namnaonensis TaxID=1851568 RepID=A0A1B8YFJ6_9GAMM|nr:hypothetical protein Phpb_03156 [Photorhabdus namnaonensis]
MTTLAQVAGKQVFYDTGKNGLDVLCAHRLKTCGKLCR